MSAAPYHTRELAQKTTVAIVGNRTFNRKTLIKIGPFWAMIKGRGINLGVLCKLLNMIQSFVSN